MMRHCGIWKTRQRLIAVIVDDSALARCPAISACCTDEARRALVCHIQDTYGPDCAFVISEALPKQDNFAIIATQIGASIWVVPDALFKNVCLTAGLSKTSSKRFALMLARLPLCSLFRKYLRPIRAQIPLPF
jgi:hypothetical protein